MADATKTAPKTATADVKDETVNTATEEQTNTREDVRAAIGLLRYKLAELERDSKRSRPYLSKNKDEAAKKFTAAVASVVDFAQFLDKEPSH